MVRLWGIDDPIIRESLERRALSKDQPVRRILVMTSVIVGVGALCGVGGALLGAGGWSWGLGPVSGVAAIWILGIWEKSRMRKYLPDVLDADGRCPQCGYDLERSEGLTCPECGHKRASAE